jgi:hypothetical protein
MNANCFLFTVRTVRSHRGLTQNIRMKPRNFFYFLLRTVSKHSRLSNEEQQYVKVQNLDTNFDKEMLQVPDGAFYKLKNKQLTPKRQIISRDTVPLNHSYSICFSLYFIAVFRLLF